MPNVKNENVVRIAGRVPLATNADLDRLSAKLGMSKSAVINMAITMGVLDLRRVIEPETMLTPELLDNMKKVFNLNPGGQLQLPEA